jgi:hypothetical protein
MNLTDTLKSLLLHIPVVDDQDAIRSLRGTTGRGNDSFSSKLQFWLERNKHIFPELITVENIDHVSDLGVDLLLTGQISGTRVGFQIKSDNDLANKHFTRELKAQMTDARSWNLSLYVVVFACRPTIPNQKKYLHIVNLLTRFSDSSVLVITPNRTAALLEALDLPAQAVPLPNRSWSDFFIAVGHTPLTSLYLDEWQGLQPDQRFVPPREYDEILKAVNDASITILVGPPAIGKTFTALQLLWQSFCQDRTISWITPSRYITTEGAVTDDRPLPDMKQRIDLLTRQLGTEARQVPLDPAEFITAHLKPNSTIYIEDPFGKLDEEFSYSLHTYRFFDLDQFISAIRKGTSRYGCRIIISSREGLFEQWIANQNPHEQSNNEFAIIHLNRQSYKTKQNSELLYKLITAFGHPDASIITRSIAPHVEIPYDADIIVRELPRNASIDQITQIVRQYQGNYKDKLRNRITAYNDSNRLFLLTLVATSDSRYTRGANFYVVYKHLHDLLIKSGDFEGDLGAAYKSYRALFSRSAMTTLRRQASGRGIALIEKDDRANYHLEAVHSTIIETIIEHLNLTSHDWLYRVASELHNIETNRETKHVIRTIALLLLQQGIGIAKESIQDSLLKAVFPSDENDTLDVEWILSKWKKLPFAFKDGFYTSLAKSKDFRVAEVCSLPQFSGIPQNDAWRFYRILLATSTMGANKLYRGFHPWQYLLENIKDIPDDMSKSLDARSKKTPIIFASAMGALCVRYWHVFPKHWRDVFFRTEVLSDDFSQEILSAAVGSEWNDAPDILRSLFVKQANHEDAKIRAVIGAAALVYHDADPAQMQAIYMATLEDTNPDVPILVMRQGLGDDEHDVFFATSLLERADKVAAGAILQILIDRGEPSITWKRELALDCIIKGQEFAQAVLCYETLVGFPNKQVLGYKLILSPEKEPEPVKLAWVWACANASEAPDYITEDGIIELVENLTPQYQEWALFYLSIQYKYVGQKLQNFVDWHENNHTSIIELMQEGKKSRQPVNGSRSMYGFPCLQLK